MGSAISKQESNKDKWNLSLPRSFSVATGSTMLEGPIRFSRDSRLLSMPKPSRKDNSIISLADPSLEFKPIQEEDYKGLTEVSDGNIGDVNPVMVSLKSDNSGPFKRSVSIKATQSSVYLHPVTELESGCRILKGAALSEFPSAFSRSNKFISPGASNELATERSLGLRSLLKPSLRNSRSFASPARNASDFKLQLVPKRSVSLKLHDDDHSEGDIGFDKFFAKQTIAGREFIKPSENFSQSPIFDKTILASFEKALSDDNWNSSDLGTLENVSSSSETSSEADSPKLERSNFAELESFSSIKCNDENVFEESSNHMMDAFLSRKFPVSKLLSLKNKSDWTGLDYLHIFERRCPPECEDKVVLYFTSLRGIRKTFEDCCTLRLILKGFGVYVDERDIWMHSQYWQELTEVLGAALPVPRLFILGRYIGGAEEVEQLNEEGILVKMMEGLPIDQRQACAACGDIRFIPCITCSGSCKIFSDGNMIERCQECNENGLIMCPWCDA